MKKDKVVIVDEKGMRVDTVEKINLKYLYSVCCKDTPGNQMIEVASGRFPDKSIVIYLHEEGRLEKLPSYVITDHSEDFAGPILVCGSEHSGEDGLVDVPLTNAQVDLIQRRLHVLKDPVFRSFN